MEQCEKINCNVVLDLLPLYADSVLGADSTAIVDAHLPHCPSCASELEWLRKPLPGKFSGPVDVGGLFRITEALRKKYKFFRKTCNRTPFFTVIISERVITTPCGGLDSKAPSLKESAQ